MEQEGASFDKKFFAWLIDKVIALAFFGLYLFLFWAFATKEIPSLLYVFFSLGLSYLTYILLFVMFHKPSGSSIGMLIFRIKSVHFSGGKILLRESLIRAILSGLFAFAIANAAYMLMAHTERSAIDQLTETYVVRR